MIVKPVAKVCSTARGVEAVGLKEVRVVAREVSNEEASLTHNRREEVAEWARGHDGSLIVDASLQILKCAEGWRNKVRVDGENFDDLGDKGDLEVTFFLGVDSHTEVVKLSVHEVHVCGADLVSRCEETMFQGVFSMLTILLACKSVLVKEVGHVAARLRVRTLEADVNVKEGKIIARQFDAFKEFGRLFLRLSELGTWGGNVGVLFVPLGVS